MRSSRLIPFLSDEVTALIVSPANFSPAEAIPLCLVSKCWRELGQSIVWRELLIAQDEPGTPDPAQILLFESDEVGSRLGRYVKELQIHGCFDFTRPLPNEEEEDVDWMDAPAVIGKALRNFEFVVEGYRKVLKLCTILEDLKFVDFHSVARFSRQLRGLQ